MIRIPNKTEKTTGKKSNPVAEQQEPAIKHSKPKILLVDVENKVVKALQDSGWNVVRGTFGQPYKVQKADGFSPVIVNYSLPNFSEQEIVIVDLYKKNIADGPEGEKHVPDGDPDWWAKCNKGQIDPRIRSMRTVRNAFDRILQNGGIFIIFADCKKHQTLLLARKKYRLYDEKTVEADIWDFLSELQNIDVADDHGLEMEAVSDDPIGNLVAAHLKDGSFLCVVRPRWQWTNQNTKTITISKFKEPVGLVHRGKRGLVIIVPQVSNKPVFLQRLIGEILPGMTPHLFPTLEQGRWIHRMEYELPHVVELEAKKLEVEREAKAEIEELSKEAESERARLGWLHNLLTGTDFPLVEAVKKALHVMGFQKIVDVDAARDKEGKTRREDLQIHDQSPILVVDIKGVGGLPSDEDALQADKHATIRIREWNRTDVVSLSIINHQRHLPPLERDNSVPFRKEILDHAEESQLGLLTTWDLFRLVRSYQKNGWKFAHVKPLFYRKGRITIIPEHYKYLGRISHVWKEAFSINIEAGEIRVKDHIAFELTSEFEEKEVASLKVEDNAVRFAEAGSDVGVKTTPSQPNLKKGMAVYLVQRENG